jgi:lysozyme
LALRVHLDAHAGICLVRWESNFNTSAIGSLNSDGSLDHGLFQISDLYWCDHANGMDSACGLTCESIDSYYYIIF